MGLFDALIGQLGGGSGQLGGAPAQLLSIAMEHFSRQPGGVQSLINKFESAGLGQAVQSWIGTGQNQPISADQLRQAVGQPDLEQIARQANLPEHQSSSLLAGALPELVDKLTPGGRIPQGGLGSIQGMLGGLGGLFNR